jgi:hypothetical protein
MLGCPANMVFSRGKSLAAIAAQIATRLKIATPGCFRPRGFEKLPKLSASEVFLKLE